MDDLDFDELYKRYVEEFSDHPNYLMGVRQISEQDLQDHVGAELNVIVNDYGSFADYAPLDEPEVICSIFSLNEANFIADKLEQILGVTYDDPE